MKNPYQLPPLNALKAFEVAARLESISLAASELNVTHGAVSRQIKQLEESLSIQLFRKLGRGIKLTEEGQRLFTSCHSAFADISKTCQDLQHQQQQAPFVLACPGSLLARWLIPRLGQLQKDMPNLQLQLVTHEGDDSFYNSHQAIDAYLVFSPKNYPKTMQAFEICSEEIGPVVSPSYIAKQPFLLQNPYQLVEEKLLYTDSRLQAWPQWAAVTGIDFQQLKFSQGFAHLYYLLEAAVAGLGIAIAPKLLVNDDISRGRLQAPWGFQKTDNSLVLLTPTQTKDERSIQFAIWLRQSIDNKN